MRAMTPSVTYLMSPVFLDLTIENESGGVIAGNMGSLQAAHERRAVVRSNPAARTAQAVFSFGIHDGTVKSQNLQ